MCGLDWWPKCRVSASASCGRWFDLQWRRSRYALLMKPHKVETAVHRSVCRTKVFAGFSSHGDSNQYIYIDFSSLITRKLIKTYAAQ